MFPRYLTYSSLVHVVAIGWVLFVQLYRQPSKTYYVVDFLGSGGFSPGAGAGGSQPEQAVEKKEEAVKTKLIDPKEDLLIKSKKPLSKKEKEVVTSAPPIPSAPIPKPVQGKAVAESSFPSLVPGPGNGIGIGFGGGGGSGAGNFPYTWYVHTIRKKLDSNWNVTEGYSSRVFAQVAFTIKKDGSIIKIDIEEGSKDEVFDQAARRAVEYASPLPPLPSDFEEDELRVHVRFTMKR